MEDWEIKQLENEKIRVVEENNRLFEQRNREARAQTKAIEEQNRIFQEQIWEQQARQEEENIERKKEAYKKQIFDLKKSWAKAKNLEEQVRLQIILADIEEEYEKFLEEVAEKEREKQELAEEYRLERERENRNLNRNRILVSFVLVLLLIVISFVGLKFWQNRVTFSNPTSPKSSRTTLSSETHPKSTIEESISSSQVSLVPETSLSNESQENTQSIYLEKGTKESSQQTVETSVEEGSSSKVVLETEEDVELYKMWAGVYSNPTASIRYIIKEDGRASVVLNNVEKPYQVKLEQNTNQLKVWGRNLSESGEVLEETEYPANIIVTFISEDDSESSTITLYGIQLKNGRRELTEGRKDKNGENNIYRY